MKRKKLLAMLLATSMVFTMVGCGSSSQDTGSTTGTSTPIEVPDDLDIWAPYEETVTLSVALYPHLGESYPDGDDVSSNVWTRFFTDQMNVEFDTLWISDSYETQVNLTIAEGNIPDTFWVSPSQLAQLVEANMVLDMTELFDVYASDRLKSYMEYDSETFETGIVNGGLYAIPRMGYGIIDRPAYVWIRQDWKNDLGISDPETMDDLVAMCEAFMENYGGFGLATTSSLDALEILAPAWGAYPTLWLETENGIEHGGVQPEMKDALAEFADWYQKGILDVDYVISDYNKTNENVINGLTGVQPFAQWWGFMGTDVVANLGTDATFLPYKVPSATGDTVKNPIAFSNYAYNVISKDCKNPEAVIKLMNTYVYAMSEEAVGELEEGLLTELQGLEFTPNSFIVINPQTDYEQYERVSEALATGDTSNLVTPGQQMKYDLSLNWIENQDPSVANAYGVYMQQGDPQCAYALGKEIIDNKEYILTELWGANPESLNQMGSTLTDILYEGYTKIIIGAEPIDYFDTLVENWKQAGGAQVTADVQAMYGN